MRPRELLVSHAYCTLILINVHYSQPLGPTNETVSLLIKYSPVPIGQLRLYSLMSQAFINLRQLGMCEQRRGLCQVYEVCI